MKLNILYEDRAIVVCEKPVGVLSQADAEGKGSDMLTLLSEHFAQTGEKATPYVLHRLDAAVGGVMVFAKNKKSAAALSEEIARGGMQKEYFAVCEGNVEADLGKAGEMFDYLFRDAKKNKSYVTDRKRAGVKDARLSFCVLSALETEKGALSLCRVKLGTGRTHQIRVQFASRRHPLVGDKRYGSTIGGQNVALFSACIGFHHPTSGEYMTFSLPLPEGGVWDSFGGCARCCIFGAGDYHGELRDLARDSFVIAADGGLLHTEAYGIKPNLAVGDFDSLGTVPEGVETLRFPVMKDDTDMALAVKEGLARGCDSFFLFGGTGGRLDHTLANMALVLSLAKRGISAYLVGKEGVVTVLCGGECFEFSQTCEGILSVFAASEVCEGVSIEGLLYPLCNGTLLQDKALGVSNHFVGQEATVSAEEGYLFLLWDNLKNPFPHKSLLKR